MIPVLDCDPKPIRGWESTVNNEKGVRTGYKILYERMARDLDICLSGRNRLNEFLYRLGCFPLQKVKRGPSVEPGEETRHEHC